MWPLFLARLPLAIPDVAPVSGVVDPGVAPVFGAAASGVAPVSVFLMWLLLATWEVVRIQVVSSRLLQVQKIRENDRK